MNIVTKRSKESSRWHESKRNNTAIAMSVNIGLLLLFLWLPSLTFAQQPPSPGNNTCVTAQPVNVSSLPFSLDGTLDSSIAPDVDFLRLEGLPAGSLVVVDLIGYSETGEGAVGDPYLGVFDSACNSIAVVDDYGGTLNSRSYVTVPEDGTLVLAVTVCCDWEFVGGGTGTYRLSVTPTFTINSITGRVADAISRRPIPGSSPFNGRTELIFCDDLYCISVNSAQLDDSGNLRYETDYNGNRLLAGRYILNAYAEQYQPLSKDIGTINQGQDFNLGVVGIQPFPIQFSEVVPCQNVPASGGRCDYSVNIRNTQASAFRGLAWSNLGAYGTGSFVGASQFTADDEHVALTRAGKSGSVKNFVFHFDVPAKVPDYASFCTDVWLGNNARIPSLDTVGQYFLFCIQKDPASNGSFRLMSRDEAQAMRVMEPVKTQTLQEISRKLGRDVLSPQLKAKGKAAASAR